MEYRDYVETDLPEVIALCVEEGWPSFAEGLERAGGLRVDLITETAEPFYDSLHHKRASGYRVYPPFT